jgi:uncharacterized protein YeaO (DUF488 family)
MIYTSHYRYYGADRVDITVKGQDPMFKGLAPTWDMVRAIKGGYMTHDAYARQYYRLVNDRVRQGDHALAYLHQTFMTHGRFTLVCFCPPGAFCHRVLLAQWLSRDWGIPYAGEIPIN